MTAAMKAERAYYEAKSNYDIARVAIAELEIGPADAQFERMQDTLRKLAARKDKAYAAWDKVSPRN